MPRLMESIGPKLSDESLVVREISVDSFEQLRAATPTSSSEIIQVDAGRMHGQLKHVTIAGLSLGFGAFSHGLISRGVYSRERVTIGFLLDSGRGRPGGAHNNIRVWSPGLEHERRYHGGASFAAISVLAGDISSFFGQDSRFSDPASWRRCGFFRADPLTGAAAAEALRSTMSSFESRASRITPGHAEFWKRIILEAASAAIVNTESADAFVSSPVRLVRRAQEIIEGSGSEPIHISKLTASLRVSRRSLHRAFNEVLDISPINYLRRRRLCEARILLRDGADPGATIADVAFKQGFSDFGRFSGYYRSLFGENPSETLRASKR